MEKNQIELIKEHIRQELSTADKESKKATRIFVRTLREAGLISCNTKCELLEYIDSQWEKEKREKEKKENNMTDKQRNLEIIDKMFDMLVDEFGYLTTIETLANDYGLELTLEEKEYLTRGRGE